MKIGMVSLGCPKNLVDSEIMLGIIREKNFTVTADPAEAELIIVNTCGFIESAKEESVNTILQMGEYKKAGSCRYLIITGCLGQRYADELLAELPEADAVIGTEAFTDIGWAIDEVLAGRRFKHLKPLREPDFKKLPRLLTTAGHFAYLKIAEGCDNCCSYCIIPQLRGPYASRPYEAVLAEARALAESGVKELIVVAQDTTQYGLDLYGRLLLPQLLRDLNAIEGLKWIRVMYLYPNNFTDELIDAFAGCEKVCKYVDIPLQHASDRLLDTMNRYDSRAQVEELLGKLRARVPGIVIRTTFIVGFPGETEEDFAELLDFAAKMRFENAGVFEYSQEEGTVAAAMPGQIAPELKSERYHELMALQAGISEELHREQEDKVLEVLLESVEEEKTADGSILYRAAGRSYREAPDIDGAVYVESRRPLAVGSFIRARVLQGFTYELAAEPAEE